MANHDEQTPVIVIPHMPAEFIAKSALIEIAPGFAHYRLDDEGPGCIMRIGTDPMYTIGDWMGYIGWDMPEEEKEEDQKQAEKIMAREVIALHTLTLTDKTVLSGSDINLDNYREYEAEVERVRS